VSAIRHTCRRFFLLRILSTAFGSLALQLCLPLAQASELSGSATLTSEYIYRGLAMSDGDPALQAGIDYDHDSGFFAGAWASTIDVYSASGEREYELDYYAGFHYEPQAPVSGSVSLLHYTYPGSSGAHSYDYTELLVNATWRELLSVELGYTNDLYGHDVSSHHWELQFEWPVANAWVVSATLGRNDMTNAGVSKYYYWDVGASARYSRLIVDLRWFDNEQADGFAYPLSAGSQLVLGLSLAF